MKNIYGWDTVHETCKYIIQWQTCTKAQLFAKLLPLANQFVKPTTIYIAGDTVMIFVAYIGFAFPIQERGSTEYLLQ